MFSKKVLDISTQDEWIDNQLEVSGFIFQMSGFISDMEVIIPIFNNKIWIH